MTIRLTPKQAAQLGKPAKAVPQISEAHIEETICQFLMMDGWRSLKMEAVSDRSLVARFMAKVHAHALLRPLAQIIHYTLKNVMRATGVGEPGMPDRLFIRYRGLEFDGMSMIDCMLKPRLAEVLWVEFKRHGKKPRPDQAEWHERERKRGALVVVVDDIDYFIREFYPNSGLQRRTPQRFAELVNEYEPPKHG